MAEALSQRTGMPKKEAESFIRIFFDTVVESVKEGDGVVKVDGFGTFKLVAVDSRESVNVTNGERITIPGYNKLAFVPEDAVAEMLRSMCADAKNVQMSDSADAESSADACDVQRQQVVGGVYGGEGENEGSDTSVTTHAVQEPDSSSSDDARVAGSVKSSDKVPVADGPFVADGHLSIDDLIEVEEPVCVEQAVDEFSGIDLLISTPESIDDVRHRLEEATAKVAEAIDMAKRASAEKARLERLLDRLEKNTEPENMAMGMEADLSSKNGRNDGSMSDGGVADDGEKDAFARVMGDSGQNTLSASDATAIDGSHAADKKKRRRIVWVVAIVAVLLAFIVYFVHGTFKSIERVETPVTMDDKKEDPVSQKGAAKSDGKHVEKIDTLVDSMSRSTGDALTAESQISEREGKDKMPVASNDKKTEAHEASKAAKPSKPATYVVKKGETLTRISMRVYGTKDSVKAIIRNNTLVNPNNVPAGAVIKLP